MALLEMNRCEANKRNVETIAKNALGLGEDDMCTFIDLMIRCGAVIGGKFIRNSVSEEIAEPNNKAKPTSIEIFTPIGEKSIDFLRFLLLNMSLGSADKNITNGSEYFSALATLELSTKSSQPREICLYFTLFEDQRNSVGQSIVSVNDVWYDGKTLGGSGLKDLYEMQFHISERYISEFLSKSWPTKVRREVEILLRQDYTLLLGNFPTYLEPVDFETRRRSGFNASIKLRKEILNSFKGNKGYLFLYEKYPNLFSLNISSIIDDLKDMSESFSTSEYLVRLLISGVIGYPHSIVPGGVSENALCYSHKVLTEYEDVYKASGINDMLKMECQKRKIDFTIRGLLELKSVTSPSAKYRRSKSVV